MRECVYQRRTGLPVTAFLFFSPFRRRTEMTADQLSIAGRTFRSRLMVGTGKYRNEQEMNDALAAPGAEIVTVAIRRLNLENPGEKTLLDYVDWTKYFILPNTAGCETAE